MADDREQFSFSVGNFGIMSTEEIQAGEAFLSSDPEDVKIVPPKKETVEDGKETQIKKVVKKQPLKKVEDEEDETEEKEEHKEIGDKDLFAVLEEEGEKEEEEEEFPQTKKKTPTPSPEGAEEPEPETEENMFNTIAQELVSHGIFTLEEDEESIEIESPEDFLQRFQYEARKQASVVIDKYLSRFGDNYRDMFENIFVKGVNPVDYLNRYTKVEGIQSLDITDEGNQERIVRELYRSEGRSAEYIEKRINQLKNYNDLLDEATEAQKVLIAKEQKEIDDAAAKKQQEITRRQQIRNEYLNNVGRILNDKIKTKDFDGIPVDRKFAENIYGYITQERFQLPDGELLTPFDKDILDLKRPENHELKVKVAMLLQLLKEDPQLTKLAKKAVSKESNKLFENLKKTAMKTGKKTEIEEEPKTRSWFPQ
jgi:hypothetical protein